MNAPCLRPRELFHKMAAVKVRNNINDEVFMKHSIVILCMGICLISPAVVYADCFIATENYKILEQTGDCKSRHACCSTFKIAISLMGYNEGLLKTQTEPELPFEAGHYDLFEVWRQPHNPEKWMKNSCVWYSQELTRKIGIKKFRDYVTGFDYGNCDVSGDKGKDNGLTNSWLSSSLQISPPEQIEFLRKLLNGTLPVNSRAHELTRNILFLENLPDGWQLYGKTGSGYMVDSKGNRDKDRQIGWFVGWLTKDTRNIIFAQFLEDTEKQETMGGRRARSKAIENLSKLIPTPNQTDMK